MIPWSRIEKVFIALAVVLALGIVVVTMIRRPVGSAVAQNDYLERTEEDETAALREQIQEYMFNDPRWETPGTPQIPQSGIIELDDNTFFQHHETLHERRSDFLGREIRVSGYVLADNSNSSRFLVGRDLLWCCGDDMYFIGFLVEMENLGTLPEPDSPVLVSGRLKEASWIHPDNGKIHTLPAILASSLQPAAEFSRVVLPF